MDVDFGAVALLSLFRGVLGLGAGVQLGNALRDFRARKIFNGIIDLLQAAVYAGLVVVMQLEIRQYDEYPLIYWGVFALTLMAGTLKTESVLKTLTLGLYVLFGGAFFFMGGWIVLSGFRNGINIANLIFGGVFILIGGTVIGAMLYPYFKGKSLTDD